MQTVVDARGSLLGYEYDDAGRITRYVSNRYEYGAAGTSATGKRMGSALTVALTSAQTHMSEGGWLR